MNKITRTILACGIVASASGAALAQGTDFVSAETMSGPNTVTGFVSAGPVLGQETLAYSNTDEIAGGDLPQAYPLFLTPGNGWRVETTAPTTPFLIGTGDTRIRITDIGNTILAENDDANGSFYSEATGTVPVGGFLNVQVAEFNDGNFDGGGLPGTFVGFDVNVYEAPVISGAVTGQWWRFQGLDAGGIFTAETFDTGELDDTVLAAFDSLGNPLGHDDDGGSGFFSLLNGTVPNDGVVYVAVAGYHGGFGQAVQGTEDYYMTGGESTGGFGLTFVPAPGSLALAGFGGLALARRRR